MSSGTSHQTAAARRRLHRRGRELFYLGLHVHQRAGSPDLSAALVREGVRRALRSLAPAGHTGDADDDTLESWAARAAIEDLPPGALRLLADAVAGEAELGSYEQLLRGLPRFFVALHRHHRRRFWTSRAGRRALGGAAGLLVLATVITVGLSLAPEPGCPLVVTYFSDTRLGAVAAEDRACAIDVDWGEGAPHPSVGSDHFSVRWRGVLNAPEDGAYGFAVVSDDGGRLFVDGALVAADWTIHAPQRFVGQAQLSRGPHDIRVEYYEEGGIAMIQLRWRPPGQPEETIPTSAFGPPRP